MERLSLICALIGVVGCGGDDSNSSDGTGDQNELESRESTEDAGAEPDEHADASMATADASADDGADASAEGGDASEDINLDTGLDCMGACELVVEPSCENGPPSVNLCVILCDSIIASDNETCRDAFQSMLDCLDPTVVFSCDDDGGLLATRCQEEVDALTPCLPSS